MVHSKKLLYIAPALLSSDFSPLRGVQLFDFLLIRQLVEMGIHVTLPAECTWKRRLEEGLAGAMPELILTPRLFKPQWNGLWALAKLIGRSFDTAFIANISNGLIPIIHLLQLKQPYPPRLVILAHREPKKQFAKAVSQWPATLIAVSDSVAKAFPEHLHRQISVYYGLANSSSFFPSQTSKAKQKPIRFCVLGLLDNQWKGANQAVEGFLKLPSWLRSKCELHLASYLSPPRFYEPNIFVYPWMPNTEVPPFLRTMDIMIVPSNELETFSQAMVQGMLTGLPCITSNLSVLKEKIIKGGGFAYKSIEELTEIMQLLAENNSLRTSMGIIARQTAMQYYVWNTTYFAQHFLFPMKS